MAALEKPVSPGAAAGRDRGPAAGGFREQMIRTVRLAAPVVVARSGVLLIVVVDTIMTGRAGAEELAYLSLGMAPTVTLILIGIGILQSTGILSAQAKGAGAIHECGEIWRVALIHAAVLGVVAGGLCLLGEPFLAAIGQTPALARGGGGVMAMFSWSLGAVMIYVATSLFLESINRPTPGMVVMLSANVVNVGLNWVLIYGQFGLPALGAQGAVMATGIVRWLGVAALVGYVYMMPRGDDYGIRGPISNVRGWSRKLRRLGYPLGLAQGLESSAFGTLVVLAGYLGTMALGAYQIAFNLVALTFMSAIGIATATAVWVGQAVGRRDHRGVALAGWAGVSLAAMIMAAIAAGFAAFPRALASIYTTDPELLVVAATAIAVAALVLVFDGMQAVLMGALRGAGDVWIPLGFQTFSFWFLTVPGAALFAFVLDMGIVGLILGVLAGVVSASLLLGLRFLAVSQREVRRY